MNTQLKKGEKCIPSHAERMQAVLDIAWDVENRLEPHETVQFTVEAFVEFARHYVDMQDQLEHWRQLFNRHESGFALASKQIEKLLKGETL